MPALQANQAKKRRKPKKKPVKKRTKKPAVKRVVVHREVQVQPYPVYQYDPYGYRPISRPVSNPTYNFYQESPAAHVRQVSMAPAVAGSMAPGTLFDRVRAESAALRGYKQDADIARARAMDEEIYINM